LRLRWDGEKVAFDELTPLPRPMSFMTGVMIGRTVYIAGGLATPNLMDQPSLHVFLALDLDDLDAGWRELSAWPGPERFYAASATDGESFYLFSGMRRGEGEDGRFVIDYLDDAYRYDPAEGRW